jgi:hypothetical protein
MKILLFLIPIDYSSCYYIASFYYFNSPFELGGARLYAVKWYKDNEEFFRYVPRYRPPIHVHNVEGLAVAVSPSELLLCYFLNVFRNRWNRGYFQHDRFRVLINVNPSQV